jgi:hypothetical protein
MGVDQKRSRRTRRHGFPQAGGDLRHWLEGADLVVGGLQHNDRGILACLNHSGCVDDAIGIHADARDRCPPHFMRLCTMKECGVFDLTDDQVIGDPSSTTQESLKPAAQARFQTRIEGNLGGRASDNGSHGLPGSLKQQVGLPRVAV